MQIWAVGRNYADHAKELGNQVPQTAGDPLIFLKAGSCAVSPGDFRLPTWSNDVHHEVELALRFDTQLQFSHFTIALDLTARDVQEKLKSNRQPWTLAKSFTDSCPLGEPLEIAKLGAEGMQKFSALRFELKINGEVRQKGYASDMIHDAERLRRFVCERFPVKPGDWLLTGTPAGVGPIRNGDLLEASIDGLYKASWRAIGAS